MKMNRIILSLFLGLVLVSCGDKTEKNTDDKKSSNEADSSQVAEEKPVSPEELAMIKPTDVDANTVIPVTDLFNSFYVWKGKKVAIAGYLKTYSAEDSLKDKIRLVAEPGGTEAIFTCNFTNSPSQMVKKEDLIVIEGIIKGPGFGGVTMDSCTFIGVNKEAADEKNLNPFRLPKQTVLAKNLSDIYSAWEGKEVTVEGYYHSTTTSKTSYGTTWRIDLGNPETHKKKVGCRMKTEPNSDTLVANRNGVKIKGIIKGESFGRVVMEECELVR